MSALVSVTVCTSDRRVTRFATLEAARAWHAEREAKAAAVHAAYRNAAVTRERNKAQAKGAGTPAAPKAPPPQGPRPDGERQRGWGVNRQLILAHLAAHPDEDRNALRRVLERGDATTKTAIDRLLADGLIVVSGTRPGRGHSRLFRLTPAGRAAAGQPTQE